MATIYGTNIDFQVPSLDLKFADRKNLVDTISGRNLITFSRDSIGTYVGNDGLIKTAAAGEARFDHDPLTGESLGLLLEKSRTNLLTYSNSFSHAGTTLVGVTKTTNAAVAPDGTSSAVLLAETATTDAHYLRFNESTNNRSFSVYVKPAGRTRFRIWSQGGNPFAAFLLTENGSVTDSHASTASIEKYPNGWYRCTMTSTTSDTGGLRIGPVNYSPIYSNNTWQSNYTGDGSSGVYVWGSQLEAGSFPTSYIPTSGSTVTRAADVVSITNTNVYDTDSFTILNEPYGAAAGGSTLNIVGGGQTPVKRTTVYSQDLSQTTINKAVRKTDEFWRWRILGSSFALPNFTTDGQVTVDWGDGTVETLTVSEHTFSDGGGYHDVGFRLDSGTYFRPHINDNASHDTKVVATGPAPESMKLAAQRAFSGCSSLKAIDATIDTTVTTNFIFAWANCSSLTSFPLIDTSNATSFYQTWFNCSSLTTFPANFFDSWTGTPSNGCFYLSWDGCSSLTATSVENILNSIDTSGQSAPASSVDIAIDYNASSGTPNISTAVTNLKSRGWTITLNGVAQ